MATNAKKRSRRLSAEERRSQILRRAKSLFAEKGVSGVRTRELAEACGTSEALLYRFFEGKAELYRAILEEKIEEISRQFVFPEEALSRGDDEAVLTGLATQLVLSHLKDRTFMRLMLHTALEGHDLATEFYSALIPRMHDPLIAYLRRRQREGAMRRCDARLAARGFVGQVAHLLMIRELFRIGPRGRKEWERTVERLVRTTLDGLRRPEARRRKTR